MHTMTTLPINDVLRHARCVVLKIGSSLMAREEGAQSWLQSVAEDISQLRREGKQVLIVSSGAVALGRSRLKLGTKTLDLAEKQAAAAVGQPYLMQAWQAALHSVNLECAQVLITPEDTEDRPRYLNARSTLETLLAHGIVPIINENDTVATVELRYGDNDRLAARLAAMIGADALLILSDIDGLYDANPRTHPAAQHIAVIQKITPEIEALAGGAASSVSSGGMITKIMAAKMATASGCHTLILSGIAAYPLSALAKGARASVFLSATTPSAARKIFIAASLSVRGSLMIDAGAASALKAGKSLLPAGVVRVSGNFDAGDTLDVCTPDGHIIARGLAGYDSAQAQQITGKQSHEIAAILGYAGKDTLIHRDDLVMLEN